jgi:hypothetical protein
MGLQGHQISIEGRYGEWGPMEWPNVCVCCKGCLRKKTHDAQVRRKKRNLKFAAQRLIVSFRFTTKSVY